MRRLRQIPVLAFLFLAFLLHCTQACLAAGHVHTAVTASSSAHHDREHAPCHSSQTAPQKLPESCPDCRDHGFLRAVPSGVEALAGLGLSLASLDLPVQPAPFWLAQPHASVPRLVFSALSPPRHLTLSVLRL